MNLAWVHQQANNCRITLSIYFAVNKNYSHQQIEKCNTCLIHLMDALMLNSHTNAHNDKNTINLRNANSQQKEQTWAIVKFKEMKKRKVMKSLQKEARIKVSTSKCYNVIFKEMQIKRLRERIEFTVNQLRQALSEQKETINHSLIYIQKACNESIENSIQKQIDWLQS